MHYEEEDILQTCALIRLEKGDDAISERLLRLEALDKIDPRGHERRRRSSREVSIDDNIIEKEYGFKIDTIKSERMHRIIARLYRLERSGKYTRYLHILEYYLLDGLTIEEIRVGERLDQNTVYKELKNLIELLS